MAAARERGLLLGKGGLRGNVIRIAPALIVNQDEIDRGAEVIAQALAAVA